VYVLQGGLPEWEQKGYAIYAGPEFEQRNPGLLFTPQQVKTMMSQHPDAYQLVDVREPAEYADKHLPGAINIPVTLLTQRSTTLDHRKQTIVYCQSGGRSYTAIRKLRKMGFHSVGHVTLEDWEKAGFELVRP
jgi:rhodanese-related sulfurtransferase